MAVILIKTALISFLANGLNVDFIVINVININTAIIVMNVIVPNIAIIVLNVIISAIIGIFKLVRANVGRRRVGGSLEALKRRLYHPNVFQFSRCEGIYFDGRL